MPKPFIHNRCGHTMFELVMGLLILGICAAVAAPNMSNSIAKNRLKAAVKRVEADLRYARQIAKQTSKEQKVVFSVETNNYRLDKVTHLKHGSREYDDGLQEYEFKLGDDEYQAQLLEVDFDGESELVYQPSGRPVAGGTVTIGYGDREETLIVDPSGHVRLSEGNAE